MKKLIMMTAVILFGWAIIGAYRIDQATKKESKIPEQSAAPVPQQLPREIVINIGQIPEGFVAPVIVAPPTPAAKQQQVGGGERVRIPYTPAQARSKFLGLTKEEADQHVKDQVNAWASAHPNKNIVYFEFKTGYQAGGGKYAPHVIDIYCVNK